MENGLFRGIMAFIVFLNQYSGDVFCYAVSASLGWTGSILDIILYFSATSNLTVILLPMYWYPIIISIIRDITLSNHISMLSNNGRFYCRGHSVYGFSQWQRMIRCNVISCWLRQYPEWSLHYMDSIFIFIQDFPVDMPSCMCITLCTASALLTHWGLYHNRVYFPTHSIYGEL